MAIKGTRVFEWLAVYDSALDKEVQIYVSDGVPSITADKGSLALDVTNADIYQNTDGATTWVAMGDSQEDGFIRSFIGKGAAGSETPDYGARITGSVSWVGNTDDLELGVAKLDEKIGAAFTPETRTKGQLTPSTETLMTMLGAIDDAIGADAEMTSVNYVALANSIYANLSALDTQVKANADLLTVGSSWRDYVKATTGDAGLNAAANDTALSTLLPFSDDNDGNVDVIGEWADGDYILSNGATDKLFVVFDDAGTLRVTQVGIDPLAAGDTFMVRYYLPDPAGGENTAIVNYNGTDLVKVADVDWQLATGINLSGGYAAAVTAAAVAPNDTVQVAIGKLDKDQADIRTTTGTAQGDVSMGVYTGNVLTDNQTTKANIQELSDAIEAGGLVFTVNGVLTVLTQIDAVPIANADVVVWKVKAIGVTTSTQRWYGEVHAIHDGTTIVDSSIVPVLRLGTPKLDVNADVDVNAGNLRLMMSTDTAGGANFTAIRVAAF